MPPHAVGDEGYHLRALEKWGIVVRDEGATDGRERPWRAPARNLQISRAANAGSGTVAAKAFASSLMAPLLEDVEAWAGRDQSEDHHGATDIMKDRLWLTPDQAVELNETVARCSRPGARTTRRPGTPRGRSP